MPPEECATGWLASLRIRLTVELRDLFAEAYGPINELVRRSYLALVNSAPRAWGFVYRWLDRKTDYSTEFRAIERLKAQFASRARPF